MRKVQTRQSIREGVLSILRSWRRNENATPEGPISDIIQEQNDIGLDNFIFGFLSKRWIIAQQTEYEKRLSRRTGRRWAIALIQKLWDVARDQWQHRNAELHKNDKIHEYHDPNGLANDIRQEILLGAPHPLPQNLRHWFVYPNAEPILRKNGYEQQIWLDTVRQIRRTVSDQLERDGYAGMRRTMRSWLASDPT